MKVYRLTFSVGTSFCYNWTELNIGSISVDERKVPMLRSEYDKFKEMEKMNINKNIEPGRTFEILN